VADTPGAPVRDSATQSKEAATLAALLFLSQVLALGASELQRSRADEAGQNRPLVDLLRNCGEAGAGLFRLSLLSEQDLQQGSGEEDHVACVREILASVMAIFDLRHTAQEARLSLAYLFECLVLSSGRYELRKGYFYSSVMSVDNKFPLSSTVKAGRSLHSQSWRHDQRRIEALGESLDR
jgi:hypothetical protein